MSTPYSTIMNNVNVVLVDTSIISANHPYIVYVSSVSVPGRVATIRDATGYLSSPNTIIVSTLKDVLFSSGTSGFSSFSITQPFGYITLSSRDVNTWNIINTFAFPDPQGVANVSSIYVNDGMIATSLLTKLYISTPYINVDSISSFNVAVSNVLSTNRLAANAISTNNVQIYNTLAVPSLFVNTISTSSLITQSISTNTIGANVISTNLLVANAISTINIAATAISTNAIITNSCSTTNIAAYTISTNSITTNSISTNNVLVPSISTISLQATNITTNLLFAPSISTNLLQANTISTNTITTNSISTNNILVRSISTTNMAATTISTNVLAAGSISTNVLAATSIFTNTLQSASLSTNLLQANVASTNILFAATVSTNILFTQSISTNALQATNISTNILTANTLLANSISSITAKTSSLTTSSITIQSGTGAGFLTASSDGNSLLYNSKPVGNWISTATSDLFMSTFVIRASTIQTSSITLISGSNAGFLNASSDGTVLLFNSKPVGSWVTNATSDLNMCNFNINNISNINAIRAISLYDNASPITPAIIKYVTPYVTYQNVTAGPNTPIASDWWKFTAGGTVNMGAQAINNAGGLITRGLLQLYEPITGVLTTMTALSSAITFSNTLSMTNHNITGVLGLFTSTINANIITTNNISTNIVSTNSLQARSVSTISLNANSISTNSLFTPSISTTNMAAGTVSTNLLVSASISTTNMAVTTISTNTIKADTISTNTLFANSISTINLVANIVSTNKLFTNSISTINLVANTVSTNNLFTNSISTINLVANTVSTNNLFTNSISTINVAAKNISTNITLANNILAKSVSSITLNTSSMFTSSIIFGSGVTPGYLAITSDGQTLTLNNSNIAGGSAAIWATYPATSNVNMSGYRMYDISSVTLSNFGSGSNGTLTVTTDGQTLQLNNSNVGGWVGLATTNLDMNQYNISNVNTIAINTAGTAGSLTVTSDGETLKLNGSNIGGGGWTPTATSDLNMGGYTISNFTTNYSNVYSNVTTIASLLACPQPFTNAIYNRNLIQSSNIVLTTSSESNYLYMERSGNQLIWDINVSMTGQVSTSTAFNVYFELSNSDYYRMYKKYIPLSLSKQTKPFRITPVGNDTGSYDVTLNFNDTINFTDYIYQLSLDLCQLPIDLKMNILPNKGLINYLSNWSYSSEFGVNVLSNWSFANTLSNYTFTAWSNVSLGSDLNSYNAVTSDGMSNWMAFGSGDSVNYQRTILLSTDNGATWSPNGTAIIGFTSCVVYYGGTWVVGGQNNLVGSCSIITSTDTGTTWNGTNSTDFITRCTGVAYGSVWVAVGNLANPIYSSDGITWYTGNGDTFDGGNGVAYGNGIFTAVGHGGSGAGIMTSSDGIIWTAQYVTEANVACVAYGNGRWLAYSDGDALLYFSDNNWLNNFNYTIPHGLASITFDGSNFFAMDVDGFPEYSLDMGATWQRVSGAQLAVGRGIAAFNGIYIGVGDISGSAILRSGILDIEFSVGNAVAYGLNGVENTFVAVGSNDSFFSQILLSSNGSNWIPVGSPLQGIGRCVAYGGVWVVGGDSGSSNQIIFSSNGVTWNPTDIYGQTGAPDPVNGISYGTNNYVAVGNGSNYYSTNGSNWNSCTGDLPDIGNGVAYDGYTFTAVGTCTSSSSLNSIATSGDGIDWSTASVTSNSVLCTAYNSNTGRWFAYSDGDSVLYYSDDSWSTTYSNTGPLTALYCMVSVGSTMFAGDLNGNNEYSLDNGVTWNIVPGNSFSNGDAYTYGITYGNNTVVAVGTSGFGPYTSNILYVDKVLTQMDYGNAVTFGNCWYATGSSMDYTRQILKSTDGNLWTAIGNSNIGTGRSIAYANGVLVVGGDFNVCSVMYSTDNGTTFNSTDATFTSCIGLAYGNGVWVGVDSGGNIQRSINLTNWNNTSSNLASCAGVAFANGIFTVVGDGGTSSSLLISSNGNVWSDGGLIGSDFSCVTYGNRRWFAFNNADANIYYSDNNWVTYTTAPYQHFYLTSIVAADGKVFAGDNNGYVEYSLDNGINWTIVPGNSFIGGIIDGIAYANNNLVAVGASFNNNGPSILYSLYNSSNLTNTFINTNIQSNWNYSPIHFTIERTKVAYGNNTWMAVGPIDASNSSIILSIDNGTTWYNAYHDNDITCAAYGNGTWIFGNELGNQYFSLDNGNTITTVSATGFTTVNDLAFGTSLYLSSGVFVAVGIDTVDNSPAMYSTDGSNWSFIQISLSQGNAVAFGSGRFVIVGDDLYNGVFTSTDATSWSGINVTKNGTCVAYANGRWFVYSHTDLLLYFSDDNTTSWSSISGVPDFTGLTAGDTLIGTTSSGIYYSYDNGISWTYVLGSLLNGKAVAYGNGTYVAVGDYICSATNENILSFRLQPAAIQPTSVPF